MLKIKLKSIKHQLARQNIVSYRKNETNLLPEWRTTVYQCYDVLSIK